MNKSNRQLRSRDAFNLLLRTISTPCGCDPASWNEEVRQEILSLDQDARVEALALAHSNHVVVRWLDRIVQLISERKAPELFNWAQAELAIEHGRIDRALAYLAMVCEAFEHNGIRVAVIKSLDHWPDLGSDLDLYTDGKANEVLDLMKTYFSATLAPRSWGDRMAQKWNLIIPGLPELLEIHVGRLGQTGEQVVLASSLLHRTRRKTFDQFAFLIPSPVDQVMLSTLQRMYRHFYFRLCDVLDTATLADSGAIDYTFLARLANEAGIWSGVATYLQIVADYVGEFRGAGIGLPQVVTEAAQFGGKELTFERSFLRIPIVPQSVRLFGSQMIGSISRGELRTCVRLGLFPWLASAAVVGHRITGSDKGIW